MNRNRIDTLHARVARYETSEVIKQLEATHGNVTRAAKLLGLSRRGLQLKLITLKIDPNNYRPEDPYIHAPELPTPEELEDYELQNPNPKGARK